MISDADLLGDLDDFDPDVETPEPAEGPIPVPDEETATKLMRRLRGISRERARIKRIAAAEIERVQAWASDRNSGLERAAARLQASLETYTRYALAGQRRRSLVTPAGSLKLTAARHHIEIVDEDAFVAWANANGRSELLKLAPSKSAVGDALKAGDLAAGSADDAWADETSTAAQVMADGGEIIPGVAIVTPKQDSFSVVITE